MFNLIASGGTADVFRIDGKVIKMMEDVFYGDVLEETALQQMVADHGLAPQVRSISDLGKRVLMEMDSVPMDMVSVTPEPVLLEDLEGSEMVSGLILYCKILQVGVIHADFHTGNWFMNGDGETMAIDFGVASTIGDASDSHLRRALIYMIPVLERLGMDDMVEILNDMYSDPQVIRNTLQWVAGRILKTL